MTEKERFHRAFSPLHASPDTLMEVQSMTEQHTGRRVFRKAAAIGLAAALVLALGGIAYAADIGGIQYRVQLWIQGDQTDVVMTAEPGRYTLEYPDKDGDLRQQSGGGVALNEDGTERPLTQEEMLEQLNAPEVEYSGDGRVLVYYRNQTLDITDQFEDGVCYVKLEDGEETLYMTVKYQGGYATDPSRYVSPWEFN